MKNIIRWLRVRHFLYRINSGRCGFCGTPFTGSCCCDACFERVTGMKR